MYFSVSHSLLYNIIGFYPRCVALRCVALHIVLIVFGRTRGSGPVRNDVCPSKLELCGQHDWCIIKRYFKPCTVPQTLIVIKYISIKYVYGELELKWLIFFLFMFIILKQMIAILHLLNDVSMLQRASFSSYSNYIYCVDFN